MSTTTPETLGEQLVSPEGEALLKAMSNAYARSDGYNVQFTVAPEDSTFSTTCTLDEKGAINVRVSPELLRRAEAEDRLEFLGVGVVHELGHVRRFQAKPSPKPQSTKDGYFTNIVDDIAINYDGAKRMRFFHDMTQRVYDDYLFPVDKRAELTEAPRHKQFMESLLVLAMTTDAHARTDVDNLLEQTSLEGLDESVTTALGDVLAHEQAGGSFNLLGQLRAYGSDVPYADKVAGVIRAHYDALYEADESDQSSGSGQGDGKPSSGEGQPFDYSDSAACGHSHEENTTPNSQKPDEAQPSNASDITDTNSASDAHENSSLDIPALAKEIAENIKRSIEEAKANTEKSPYDMTPEQLEKLRTELGLDESDFAGYMNARQQYAGEIRAVEDLILQLRREHQDDFLAPGREVAARGHRIRVDKLMKAIASASLNDQPDIWKHPRVAERIEHEFDGLDLYLLCDVSQSMAGAKAQAAAGSSVVIEEGLLGASSQMAGEQTPVVRLQIEAFGAGHEMLCQLTDTPTPRDLGRTFAALSNPDSGSTEVAGALNAITPETGRLSVVVVVSDGGFHDSSLATEAGQKLADKNAALIQFVFGGANVSKLADTAQISHLNGARDLPQQLLGMLPELLDMLRRNAQV